MSASPSQPAVAPADSYSVFVLRLRAWHEAEGEAAATVHEFIVSQCYGVNELGDLAKKNSAHFGMQFTPWASVAAPLKALQPGAAGEGRAYCFLPLPVRPPHARALRVAACPGRFSQAGRQRRKSKKPSHSPMEFLASLSQVKTGLPVHVNAYFELSSNRYSTQLADW